MLSLKQGVQFHYLAEQDFVFRPSVKVRGKWSALFYGNSIFFQKILFHDVCVKNFVIVYAQLNELGHKIKSLVLNRGAK